MAPEVKEFRILNLARLNMIIDIWRPIMVGDAAVADRAVATDKVLAAIHDIRMCWTCLHLKRRHPAVLQISLSTYQRCPER